MKTIIVSRHEALVEYIMKESGLAGPETPVFEHVKINDVIGAHVIGNLPLHLAAEAKVVTTLDINTPPGKRGFELSYAELKEYGVKISSYEIKRTTLKQEDPYERFGHDGCSHCGAGDVMTCSCQF